MSCFPTDWQPICPDSSSLSLRRRQEGGVARQLLLRHARPPWQEQGQGAKQVTESSWSRQYLHWSLYQEADQDHRGYSPWKLHFLLHWHCSITSWWGTLSNSGDPLHIKNLQKTALICQSSALSVFLMVKTSPARMDTYTVSQKKIYKMSSFEEEGLIFIAMSPSQAGGTLGEHWRPRRTSCRRPLFPLSKAATV